MMIGWNNATFDNRNDIVFDGRNQNYGAFEMLAVVIIEQLLL